MRGKRDIEQPVGGSAEHQPLMNKLEGRSRPAKSPWHSEGIEWSKTGRSVIKMIQDIFYDIFGS